MRARSGNRSNLVANGFYWCHPGMIPARKLLMLIKPLAIAFRTASPPQGIAPMIFGSDCASKKPLVVNRSIGAFRTIDSLQVIIFLRIIFSRQ